MSNDSFTDLDSIPSTVPVPLAKLKGHVSFADRIPGLSLSSFKEYDIHEPPNQCNRKAFMSYMYKGENDMGVTVDDLPDNDAGDGATPKTHLLDLIIDDEIVPRVKNTRIDDVRTSEKSGNKRLDSCVSESAATSTVGRRGTCHDAYVKQPYLTQGGNDSIVTNAQGDFSAGPRSPMSQLVRARSEPRPFANIDNDELGRLGSSDHTLKVLSKPRDDSNAPVTICVVRYDPRATELSGTIAVHNIAFEKRVFVKHTTNNWDTFAETNARYVWSRNTPPETATFNVDVDMFAFTVPISSADLRETGRVVEFIVGYTYRNKGHDTTVWDNNAGQNYKAVVVALADAKLPKFITHELNDSHEHSQPSPLEGYSSGSKRDLETYTRSMRSHHSSASLQSATAGQMHVDHHLQNSHWQPSTHNGTGAQPGVGSYPAFESSLCNDRPQQPHPQESQRSQHTQRYTNGIDTHAANAHQTKPFKVPSFVPPFAMGCKDVIKETDSNAQLRPTSPVPSFLPPLMPMPNSPTRSYIPPMAK